jgi:carboxyl-terminal processing protease
LRTRRIATLALLLGLATAAPLQADQEADQELYTSAIRLVQDRYLYPETITAEALLAGAAEQLTDRIEWLMAEVDGNRVELSHGDSPPFATVEVGGLDDLPRALAALEVAVRDAGYPIRDDMKLDVQVLKGATERLDRHSALLAGRRLERFEERISGKLLGIGLKYRLEEGEFLVRSVFEGGPAQLSGIKADDVLLRIDGISTTGMTTDDVKDRIAGPAGSVVRLLLRRGGRELTMSIERAEVSIPNMEQEILPSGVGYLSIAHFSEQTVENLRRALAELASQGALEQGLILDLRGNTGGSLIQAARSADQFLVDGRLVRTVGRDGAPVSNLIRQMDADEEGTEPPVPLVVLTDDRTASGSEILAGDLALLERAILVGQRSYGKGTVQKIYNLRQDVRLKLTVAEYLLADDVSVTYAGLEPDVATGEVVFDANGVRYDRGEDDALLFVRERPGWRERDDLDQRDDPEVALAERIVLQSRGPRRDEALAAAELVLAEQHRAEDALLMGTYAAGDIDWRPAPADHQPALADQALLVSVQLETDGPPKAGESVLLRARVDNQGSEPLHRVAVELWSQNSTWNRVTLPIGYLEPGTSGEGRRTVKLSADAPSRVDDVSVQVLAQGRPVPPASTTELRVKARPNPDISVQARLLPHPDEGLAPGERSWRAELSLRNHGREDLHGLRVRFEFPDDDTIELQDREGMLPHLPAGEEQRLDLCLHTSTNFEGDLLELELRMDAEHWGRIARWELPLGLDGAAVDHQAPTVELDGRAVATAGVPTRVMLSASDDGVVQHAVVYVNGHKARYVAGGARRLHDELEIIPLVGANRIVATVLDDQGHSTRATAYLLGRAAEDEPAVAEEGEDLLETP